MKGTFLRIFSLLRISLIISSCKLENTGSVEKDLQAEEDFTAYVNPFIRTAPLTDIKIIGYTPLKVGEFGLDLLIRVLLCQMPWCNLVPLLNMVPGRVMKYEDEEIMAFAHTNKGHWNLVNIPVLPVTGEASRLFKSSFSHDTENASPGF